MLNNLSFHFFKKNRVMSCKILFIGPFQKLQNFMDKNYYQKIESLIKFLKLNHFTIFKVDINKNLEFCVEDFLNRHEFSTNDIVYQIPNCKEKIIHVTNVQSKVKTVFEIEDLYNVDQIKSQIINNGFTNVIHRYNGQRMSMLKKQMSVSFFHWPHFVNLDLCFKKTFREKPIDILLYGHTGKVYPFRKRLLKILVKLNASKRGNLNIKILKHPGYNELKNSITGKKLSNLISKSWLCISTSSSHDFFLKKYLEIPLAGSMPIGNCPSQMNFYTKSDMICLDADDNDEQIVRTILKTLENKSALMKRIIHLQQKVLKCQGFDNANNAFLKIITKL